MYMYQESSKMSVYTQKSAILRKSVRNMYTMVGNIVHAYYIYDTGTLLLIKPHTTCFTIEGGR